MIIRPYTPEDWPRACEIHDAARRDELTAAGLEAAYLTLEETAENEGFHDYQIRVAERDHRVVGFVRDGVLRQSVFKDGELIDSVPYAGLRGA